MKHVFIINPVAGKSDISQALSKQIQTVFKNKEYIIKITEYKGHAKKIASSYRNDNDEITIYSCGGDGTLNEIVNGIYLASHISLAIIPVGTGNDFIKYFTSLSQHDFLDLKNYSNTTKHISDLIQCNNQLCINIASVGFDAMVTKSVARYKRLPLIGPKFAYYLSAFQCFLSSIHFKQSLKIDDSIEVLESSYLFVVVANGSFYGGGFHPTPKANIQDGYLDVLTIDSLPRRKIVRLLGVYKRGDHVNASFAKQYKAKKIRIEGNHPITLNLDGETVEVNNPELSILPHAITLLLPKKQKNS